jgi:hypothetical protein
MLREPTAIINAVAELARQIVPMLIVFGFISWSDQQTAMVFAVMSAFLSLASTLIIRTQVVPTEKVDAQIKQATKMPEGTTVAQVVAATEAKQG